MRIFNEVGRWYSIPCKILTQVIYVKKKILNPLKRIRVIIRTPTHGRTDGRTDRQTDRRTDEQGESSIPPLNFVSGGYNEVCIILSALFNIVVWSAKIDSHRKYVNHGEIQICLHQSDDKLFKMTIKIGTELRGACNQHGLTRISAWISVDIHYIMWDVITLPCVNFHSMV